MMKQKWILAVVAICLLIGGSAAASVLVNNDFPENDSNRSLEDLTAASEAAPSKSVEELLEGLTQVTYPSIPPELQDAYVASQLASRAAEIAAQSREETEPETHAGYVREDSWRSRAEAEGISLFEYCLQKADKDQKAALEKLAEENPEVYLRGLDRKILVIMGELPQDQPRMTKEWAEDFCRNYEWKTDFSSYDSFPQKVFFQEAMDGLNVKAGAPDRVYHNGAANIAEYYVNDTGTEMVFIYSSRRIAWKNSETGSSEVLYYYEEKEPQSIESSSEEPAELSPEEAFLAEIQKKTRWDISKYDHSFYVERYLRASEEQREKIDEIYKPYEETNYPMRAIMEIMGELDEDAPRLTLEQAKEAVENIKKDSRFGWSTMAEAEKEAPDLFYEYLSAYAVPDRIEIYADKKISSMSFSLGDIKPGMTYVEIVISCNKISFVYTDSREGFKQYILLGREESVIQK